MRPHQPLPDGVLRHDVPTYMFPNTCWMAGAHALLSSFSEFFHVASLNLEVHPFSWEERPGEFALCGGRSRSGRWAVYSTRDRERSLESYRLRYYPGSLENEEEATLQVLPDKGSVFIPDLACIRNRVVLIPDGRAFSTGVVTRPIVFLDDQLMDSSALPPAEVKTNSIGSPVMSTGFAPLADGSDVLIWNGDGYEVDGDGWRRTFELGMEPSYERWFSTVPAGDDGFFYLSDRKLFEAHRGATPRRHLPTIENIMSITHGPGGSLLLKMGNNKQHDLGKLYFAAEGNYIPLKAKTFGLDFSERLVNWFAWSEGARCIIAMLGRYFYTVPVEQVLALKRVKPRG